MKRLKPIRHVLVAACAGAALLLSVAAEATVGALIPHGTVELLAEHQSIAPGHTVYLGLRFQLEKGWHIYWVNPGDSGEPPRMTWKLPAGFTTGAIEWPTPKRLGSTSVVDFGYDDSVMLLVPLRASANVPVQPAQIAGEVKVLVCREMCILGKAELSLTLPVKPQTPAPNAQAEALFSAGRKSQPQPAPRNWKLTASDAKDSFTLAATVGRAVKQATFFPLDESVIDNAAPQKLSPAPTGFHLTLKKSAQLTKPIQRLRGVIVLSSDEAYLIDAPVRAAAGANAGHGLGFQTRESTEEGDLR